MKQQVKNRHVIPKKVNIEILKYNNMYNSDIKFGATSNTVTKDKNANQVQDNNKEQMKYQIRKVIPYNHMYF